MNTPHPSYVARLRAAVQPAPEGTVEDSLLVRSGGPAEVVAMIRRGLPMTEFHALASWLAYSEEDLAPLLGISRATLHRRKKAGQLEMPESERLIRFAHLLRRATEVFEREEAARDWLKTPAVAFSGETPLSFADTEIGAREVDYLLGRLEHGVFS